MKKEKSGKKSLLWLWITIGVVAALVVAGVLCVALGVFDSKEEQFTSKIYWNLDRAAMFDPETGMSARESAEDGIYYIRFAVGGGIEELPIIDGKLANIIDTKDIMCLKFDESGTVIDVVDVEDVYVKIADKVFVQQVVGNTIQANSSQALNGMPVMLNMAENACVNNVSTKTGNPGDPSVVEPMDQIVVYGLDENTPTDVFITDRWWYSDVYWRVSERMFDATNKCSTRQQAEDGYWYMDWTVNGETVTLRTKMQDVIDAWDGYTPNDCCCGMVFDENGDVINCFNAGLAARGTKLANNYEVTALAEDGSSFTATRIMFGTEVGKTYTSVIDENTKIYNVNSTADVKGEPTTLQMDDRVLVVADAMGKAKIIFVTNRMVDSPMYYNISRSYSSGLKKSTRTPDASGWYHIKLAVKGTQVTYRTRDVDLVNQIDGYSLSVFGLKVENGVILKAYDAVCVAGNYSFANNNFVDSVDGLIIATSNAAGVAANGVLTPDCEVYDVSGHGAFRGVATTVREGDRVLCYKNAPGEINYVYILNRYEAGTVLYWNVNRYYANGASSRGEKTFDGAPLLDEDGYYHFRVIKVGGTDVSWVKTKDKEIVDRMDSYGTPTAFSLRVNSSGVVTAAYPVGAATGGYQASNYLYVTHADEEVDGKWHIKAYSTGATGTFTVAENVNIYNFSQDTYVKGETALPGTEMKGSRTSIRIGDRVSCIAGRDGKIHTIFVVEREVSGTTIAIRKSGPQTKIVDGKTVLIPDEDGYYNFELLINGEIKRFKTDNEDLANKINSQSYAFAMKYSGDVITNIYNAIASPEILSKAGGEYYDVVSISGGQITLKRNKPSQTNTGTTTTFKIAYNCKVYVRDTSNGRVYGEKVTLEKGDRIFGYMNYNNELFLAYLDYECYYPGGNMGKCSHCNKTVHWETVAAGYSVAAGITETETIHFYAANTNLYYNKVPAIAATARKNGVNIVVKNLETGEVFYNDDTLRVWNDADDLPVMGRWKLNTDVTMDKPVTAGGKLYIDLNGHDITRTVAADQLTSPRVYNVAADSLLIIDDTSAAGDGTVSSVQPAGQAINSYGGVIHVPAGAEFVLEGGIIDGSNLDNIYTSASNGTISVGGKLTVNGGVIKGQKRGSSNGGAIGGWADTDIIINGGTIYAGGSFLQKNEDGTNKLDQNGNVIQKVNGAAIATTGRITINGGEFVGPGKDATAEQKSRSGGLVYANGDSMIINGGVFRDGFGTGYGFNIYYERNYLGVADPETGVRPTITGGGEVVIGGTAFIQGGVTIRSGKASDPVKLTVKNTAMIDDTDAVGSQNIRLVNGELYLNADTTPITTTKAAGIADNANYDISLVHTCKGAITGFITGHAVQINHNYGNDSVCDDCGHDKDAVQDWNAAADPNYQTKLPTSGNWRLTSDVTVANTVTMSDNLYIDLNGYTITGAKAPVITANGFGLTVTDTSGKTGEAMGRITTETVSGNFSAGVIYGNSTSTVTIKNGIIDGTNVTTTYTTANAGTITVGKNLVVEGGIIKGWTSSGNGGAIGSWGNTTITISGGEIIGGTVTKSINGTGFGGAIAANGNLTITGGKISGGTATEGGDNIRVGNANAVVTISGGEIDGGVQLDNFHADSAISGNVTIKEGANYGLKIASGKVINMTGLTGGEIYVDADGVFTTNFADAAAATAAKAFLKPGVEGSELTVDGTAIKMGIAGLLTEGTMKLTNDLTINSGITLTGDLYIDLNGHTITSSVAKVFTTGAYKLTIDDTSGKTGDQLGKVVVNTTSGSYNAGVVYVSAGGEFVLENGVIDGSKITTTYTAANAGTITVGNGKINNVSAYGEATINGGKVLGMKSSGNGSAVGMMNLTSLTITGGEIVGNTVTKSINGTGYGGAIMANGHLTITGGKISGGTATVGGDNIYVNNASAVVTISGGEIDGGLQLNAYAATSAISGSVKINAGANYGLKIPAGKTVDFTGLTGGMIYVDADGVFTTNFATADAATAAKAFMESGDNTKTLSVDGTAIKMAAGGTTPPTPEPPAPEPPTDLETAAWTEWNATADASFETKLPTTGKYKLTSNVTVGAHVELTGDLWIDLNGYTITRNVTSGQTSKQYVFNVNNAEHTLLITDLSGKTGDELGKITASYASGLTCSTSGGLIQVDAGEWILENGIIDGTPITANITTANNAAVMIADRFTMNGGVIKGQYSQKYTSSGQSGSAIGAWGNSVIVINGGTIQAYQATGSSYACSSGTCIATSGNLTINGGELIGSRAGARGGLIYATKGGDNSAVTINGGVLKNGFGLSGGAIFAQNISVTINGGVIVGNKAATAAQGHSIDAFTGTTLTIGGNAVISGGVTVRSNAKLVLKDSPVISDKLGTAYADITLNSASAYLNNTTGTAIATANGNYSLTYGTDGKVNGLAAYATMAAQTESDSIPTEGNVKLTADVTLTEAVALTGNLQIDLNGHTVTFNVPADASAAQYAFVADGKTLIIKDSAATKGSVKTLVEGDAAVAIEVGVVKVANGGKFYLDAVIDGSDVITSYIGSNAAAVTVDTSSQFVLLGGEVKGITNNNAVGSSKPGGSAIAVPSTGAGSKILISGGKVTAFQSNTSVSNCAPVIYNDAAATEIFILGGELQGSRATNHAGAIMTKGNMYITGGKIYGGTAYHSGLIQSTGAVLTITGGELVGGKATANNNALGGASIDYAKSGGVLTIGGNAKIAGGVSIRGGAKLVLKGKAVIDMNLAGQEQKLFNIRIKSGSCSIYLNDTTGTALASATSGTWDVAYDNAGNITGITAK